MENTSTGPKAYVLQLVGDPINSGGMVTIDVAAVSLDRSRLEALLPTKEAELDEYFEGRSAPCDCDDEDCEEEHDDGEEWCYMNSDYSSRPEWVIDEYVLV